MKIWFPDKFVKRTPWNNVKIQLTKLLVKAGLSFLNHVVVAIRFYTQSINHYISLARGIQNITHIVNNCFHPSSVMEIQIWLSKHILQTLMVGVNLRTVVEKVM